MEAIIFCQWWRSHQSLAREGLRTIRFCVLPWKDEPEPRLKLCLGRKVDLVQEFITIQNIGHTWWSEPMEFEWNIFAGFTTLQKSKSSALKWAIHQNFKGRIIFMSMFHDISWGSEDDEQECDADANLVSNLCKEIPTRTMVIPRTWIGNKVVLRWQRKTRRKLGSRRWIDDDQIQRKRTPSFPSHESTVSRNAEKQKRWDTIYTLLCRWWRDWNCFSHNYFCWSAQYLRRILRFVWRIQILPCENGETCYGRTICPFFCAHKCDEDKHTFERWSCARRSIAKLPRTSGKAFTTWPIDQILHWCRILDNSWSRTILHDKAHWRVLTICRTSDMSWVHFTTRWKINWPERLASSEHQNWTRIGSHNQLPPR